ncbi:MAG: rhodanese-like domain-containing protein [Gemmatimonadetes bacterium]|nr:rhodanese-like domain-containing protein [Gemmatimonadota bacterium]
MKHNRGAVCAWLAVGVAISCFLPAAAFGQEPKGAFVDGEFVENYEYVPDFMPPEELLRLITEKSDSVVIVDTAAPLIWEDEHIPGAVNFPWVHELSLPVPLPRDKTLVIYCACNDHEDSVDIAKKLSQMGYLKVKVLQGGWFKWLDLGYRTVSKDEEEKEAL